MSHTQELVLVESWVLETKLLIGNDYFHTYFFTIFSKETWKMIKKKRGYGCCFINRKYSIWKYSIWAKVTLAWVHFSSGAVFHTTIGQMTQNHFWRQRKIPQVPGSSLTASQLTCQAESWTKRGPKMRRGQLCRDFRHNGAVCAKHVVAWSLSLWGCRSVPSLHISRRWRELFPCDSSLQISSLVIVKAVTLCKDAHSQNLQLRLVFVKETIALAKIV